jgi:arylsulfatase A-like enzyme
MLLLSLLLTACQPRLPEQAPSPPLLLARHPELLVALELPATNHPGGQPAPDRVPLRGSFERCWSEGALEQYAIPLPVGQVFYGHSSRVPPLDMQLLNTAGEPIPWNRDREDAPGAATWRARGATLNLRPAMGEPPPAPGELTLVYPAAAAWENSLDPATSELEGAAFALRSVKVDDLSRQGLLLPAPGSARWTVRVPPGGVLDYEARILPHAVDQGVRSDGASLAVRVHHDGRVEELRVHRIDTDRWQHQRLELGPWANQQVELEISSLPGDSAELDYVFVANPVVFAPSARPRQVVLVFVDTLRRDHMGLYGYERDTSPHVDAWAKGAVVFDDARATSSWTLPSTRSLLTGMPPGAWGQVPSLQASLASRGFTTGAFVANAFLTDHFDMGRDWAHYGYSLLAPASEQVDQALEFLERNADRDSLVMVQLMDPHMPYREPEAFRDRWAGPEPSALAGKINRRELRALHPDEDQTVLYRRYLVDRYDQNIAYVDHELDRLLGALSEDAVVVFFADHGEEFWEHGSVEHGHTLYDELLRVPLVLKAPGLGPSRIDTPVSLLDVTPTLLDLLDIDPTGQLQGRSLVALARGDQASRDELSQRPLFFGGLLYDDEAWGVRSPAGLKWVARDGTQALYDLVSDPRETTNLAKQPGVQLERFPPLLAQALGREVVPVWRLMGRGGSRVVRNVDGSLELRHPAGLLEAWHPPSLTGDMAETVVEDGALVVRAGEGLFLPREIFVRPAGDPYDALGLELSISSGQRSWSRSLDDPRRGRLVHDAHRRSFLTAGQHLSRYDVNLHWAPLPYPDAAGIESGGGTIDDHLKALGYIDD